METLDELFRELFALAGAIAATTITDDEIEVRLRRCLAGDARLGRALTGPKPVGLPITPVPMEPSSGATPDTQPLQEASGRWSEGLECPRRDLDPHAPYGAPAPQAGVSAVPPPGRAPPLFQSPGKARGGAGWGVRPGWLLQGTAGAQNGRRPGHAVPVPAGEPLAGTGPASSRLRGECSAIELKGHMIATRTRAPAS
jgi:hypothetical protein